MPKIEPLPPAPAGWEEKDMLRAQRTQALLAHGRALQDQAHQEAARASDAYDRRTAPDRAGWEQQRRFRQTPEWKAQVRAEQADRREANLKMIKREEEEKQAKAKEAAAEAAAIAAFQAKLRQKRD
jgi:hypothetical protein